jgi:hypothetical protein
MTHPIDAKWAVLACVVLVMTAGVTIVTAYLAPGFFEGWLF